MRCIDLFAGCGGMSLGFQNAGFTIMAAFENWKPAINVYKENFHHPIFEQDLTDEKNAIEKIKEYLPDLIMGGPPCQDFSSAGKRDINGGRADLTYNFANIVCAVKPEWFVMENVEQIKKSHILVDIIDQFEATGYGLTSIILDASYCGIPQARTRFFLIGHYGDKHNQLKGIIKKNLSDKPTTIRDYLGDKLGLENYYRHPRNYNRRGVFSIDEPSPTVRGVNRPVPKGYKLNTCDPANVILEDIRPLTTIERSWLQTFPENFKFVGCKTNLEQMIGNAVPVKLGTFIASAIKEYSNLYINEKLKTDQIFQLSNRPLHKDLELA
ncbi:DNA cytosine methyltransferase [Legionella taurinensis]|uniref:Cytosine-specific methyltransferase n=1 Tax=Legionella taurinensis TaxID=70611 RepID=A0A3A5L7M5_9GAMM|nr:DNA cytosine methyltransferase [Legionella taurinensis]RJT43509.1 DNA (cytosine-5-)-methyltransferase [Legionella taurinensis]RJT64453.1 DNA (cytosine-5-)-methyltransferase [Legionella taurinensis]STY25160.1 modification methylase (Eco47II, Sau96I) [Legionella taurinensis]